MACQDCFDLKVIKDLNVCNDFTLKGLNILPFKNRYIGTHTKHESRFMQHGICSSFTEEIVPTDSTVNFGIGRLLSLSYYPNIINDSPFIQHFEITATVFYTQPNNIDINQSQQRVLGIFTGSPGVGFSPSLKSLFIFQEEVAFSKVVVRIDGDKKGFTVAAQGSRQDYSIFVGPGFNFASFPLFFDVDKKSYIPTVSYNDLKVCSAYIFQDRQIIPVPTGFFQANQNQDQVTKEVLPSGQVKLTVIPNIPSGFSNYGVGNTMNYTYSPIVRNTFEEIQNFTTIVTITYHNASGGPILTASNSKMQNYLLNDWVTTLFDINFFDFEEYVVFDTLEFQILSEKGSFDVITPVDAVDYIVSISPNKYLSFNYDGLPNVNIFDV
jgi:hypothetical protein